ncbi:sugar ABC transporter ATP-binding protein [Lichenihabitans sp. Uapishka_5]|uniref:sugar ABC transporter ATP-binding protein n=1 Tax=Lichenihabitans sp. Uapishka_5 TaxID=3037302 RepID=UPI0029E80076|nr:sugar ABC transporter ATP-binding protein [Lichenihabitans sp. Uapishka_5]MDX7952630.1 sugar ABC transporter ATP-binding protein [Lichenihabitans sp. Uapishka_5]
MSDLLAMEGVSKSFVGVPVLTDVSLTVVRGEVLGIVGENGAGKSTLMKVLAGIHRTDAGIIRLEGKTFEPGGPGDAIRAGIKVVHQELSLFPDRTVAENIFAGALPRTGFGTVRQGQLMRDARAVLARVGLNVAASAKLRTLSLAQRQLVEIGRALSQQARIIIMDEPTATLTGHEVEFLKGVIAGLKAEGVGIIFISHHLEEVFAICDRVAVMRDGRCVDIRPVGAWTEDAMVQVMVNRPIDKFFPKLDIAPGPVLIEVERLASDRRFHDVSFQVKAGEIYGLAGLVGAGRTEVLKTIFGALPLTAGMVRIAGQDHRPHSPRRSLAAGIVLTPEDRKAEGLVLPFSIRANIGMSTLGKLARFGVMSRRAMVQLADQSIRRLRIRTTSSAQEVRRLSGGNQQKVVLARAMSVTPRVFMLDEPTRGVDVGAKVEVYTLIGELAAAGAAILIVSSDLLELLGLCDRIGVMRAGRLVGEVDRSDFSQDRIMSLAAIG